MTMNTMEENARKAADKASRSATADKAKGHGEQIIGKVKQKVGHLIGDEELEAKGAAQRAEGKKDQIKGEIKETIEDVKDHVKAGVEVVRDKIRDKR